MDDALHVRLGPGMSIDDALIQGAVAGLSPEEISRRIDGALSPARVILRTRELLKGGDWLEDLEKERALLLVLQRRVADLQRDGTLEGVKLQLSLVKELLSQLNRRRDATDEQLNTYNVNVGRQLGHVVDLALTYMRGALRTEIEPARWDALVQEAMAMAWIEIEKKQVAA